MLEEWWGVHLCFSTYNWGSNIRESQHQDLVMVDDVLDVRGMLRFIFASALRTEAQDQRLLASGSHHEQWLRPGCWRNVGVHLCFNTYNWGSRSGAFSIRILPSAVRSPGYWVYILILLSSIICVTATIICQSLSEVLGSSLFQHLQLRPVCVCVCVCVWFSTTQCESDLENNRAQ
jgi:hypothetical protein